VEITHADVQLTIYRPGESRPDGTKVARGGAWVDGAVTYRLNRPAQSGDELLLLDFTSFMTEEPLELDEVALATYVAGKFQAGRTDLLGWWGTGEPRRVGTRRDILLPLQPGQTEVTLRYGVTVPRRYWPFGCVRGRCSLSGALAPLPSVPASGGRFLPSDGRVVAPARWSVDARLATPGDYEPGGGRKSGRPVELVVLQDPDVATPYPSVLWGRQWYRERHYEAGVEVVVLHPKQRPSGQVPHETFVQLRRDVPGQVMAITRELIRLATRLGLEGNPGSRIVLVQGPLRSSVAESHPGVVMVSDQAFELLPSQRLVKFHQEAIARAVADTLMSAITTGDYDPSASLWTPGAMAFALLQLWEEVRLLPDEYASDILRNFTFVPAVDRFLYTQQASFSSAYFRGVEDQPKLRNHPLWFSHELPTGRRIHAKLTDTLGPKGIDRMYREVFSKPGTDITKAAEHAYGFELDWFFDQWLGPYPEVDYAIAHVRTTPNGEQFDHEIVIERRADVVVIEPVQVLVTERGGEQHFLIWNGEIDSADPGPQGQPARGAHTFELTTRRRIANVRLDPRQRLVQTPVDKPNVDPRFNDRTPPSFRFLYTGAGLSVAASEFLNANTAAARFNAVAFFAAFEGSLRRDLRRTGHVLVSKDRETIISVGSGANFWFGPKRNQQRRQSRVRAFVTAAYLNDTSLDERGGVRVSERLSLVNDTTRFSWWPEKGRTLSVGTTARQIIRVDGLEDDHRANVSLDAGWVQRWRIMHNHVIATLVSGQIVVPVLRDPEFRSLTRVGGIGGLSGYAADEVFGLGLVTVQAEYRHLYIDDLPVNLVHLAWLRGIGGAAFAGVATTSRCDDYSGWFGPDSWYAHVGYAITGRFSILGVTPQLFRVEASVPLVRRTGVECLDKVLPDFLAQRQGLDNPAQLLPPFNINILFAHPF
jgi:hypothetical protein